MNKLKQKNISIVIGSNKKNKVYKIYFYEFNICDFMATEKIIETEQELFYYLY